MEKYEFTIEEQKLLSSIFQELFGIQDSINKAYSDAKIGIKNGDWNLVANKILELEELDKRFGTIIEASFTGKQISIVMELFRD